MSFGIISITITSEGHEREQEDMRTAPCLRSLSIVVLEVMTIDVDAADDA